MKKDIFYSSKEEILNELSKIENLIFIGGTAEYIQGVKNKLGDIDIVVTNVNDLKNIGYLFFLNIDPFYGRSGKRAVIKLKNVLIDIFIEYNLPQYINIKGFKCETVESIILSRENALKFDHENLSEERENKIRESLKILKSWIA